MWDRSWEEHVDQLEKTNRIILISLLFFLCLFLFSLLFQKKKMNRRRYFVLSGKHMTYHEDASSLDSVPALGVLHLDEAVEVGEETGQHLKKNELKHLQNGHAFYVMTSAR